MTVAVLTVDQVKDLLQCSDKTVRARAAELGGLKFGVDWIFPAEALNQRLVDMALSNTPEPTQAPTPAAVLVAAAARPVSGRRKPSVPPTLPTLPALQLLPPPSA